MYDKPFATFSRFRVIANLLVLLATITGVLGSLTGAPNNEFVLKGATTGFTCCSDISLHEQFFWKVRYIGSKSVKDIYDTAGLVNGFLDNGRFNVTDGRRSGCYSLIIKDVKMQDAGRYFCVDEEGLGQWSGWELVILESFNCRETNRKSEYMDDNNFGLPHDIISSVCISKYIGNISPKPICQWSSGTQMFDNHQEVIQTNSTITLKIQVPARKDLNGDQLLCHVKIFGKPSDYQTTIVWTSSRLIVNYASFQQKRVQQCSFDELSLDCHPPCDFTMLRFSNGSSACEIAYPSKTNKKVYVQLQDTSHLATTIISSSTNMPVGSQYHTSKNVIVIAVLVTAIICCGFVGAGSAITICLMRKTRKRQSRTMHAMRRNGRRSKTGGETIARMLFVINMGDGSNMAFGDVVGVQQSKVNAEQDNNPLLKEVQTKKLSRISATSISEPENVSIKGVAIIGEDLFIAYKGSVLVKVYNAKTLGYKASWEVEQLTDLEDMTACNKHNCLYISNIKVTGIDSEIIKVSPQGQLIRKWETGIHCGCLSVTHDFSVLVAVYFERKLVEYETEETGIKEIPLEGGLRPNYALKDKNNHYWVCHGCGDDLHHGVSQVCANGSVLHTFGGRKGSSNKQMNTPIHLVFNDQFVWVADSKNGRVVVLSSRLKYKRTLLSEEDELSCPLRIYHDQIERRLLLCDFKWNSYFIKGFETMSAFHSAIPV